LKGRPLDIKLQRLNGYIHQGYSLVGALGPAKSGWYPILVTH